MVHWHDCGEGPNAKASSETAHRELNPHRGACDFDNDTNNVEEGGSGNGQAATKSICERSGAQAPDECTDTVLLVRIVAVPAIYEDAYASRPTIVPCLMAEKLPFSPNLSRKSDMARKPVCALDSTAPGDASPGMRNFRHTGYLSRLISEHKAANASDCAQNDRNRRHAARWHSGHGSIGLIRSATIGG